MQNCGAKHWPSRCLQLSGLLFSAPSQSFFESLLPRSGQGEMSPDVWQVGSESCPGAFCSEFPSGCVLRNTLEWVWCWEWGVGMWKPQNFCRITPHWKPWGFCRITPHLPGVAEGSGLLSPHREFSLGRSSG